MTKPFIGISSNILRDNGGPYVDLLRSYVNQDYPRYYQAVFLALYELIINENMQLDDEQKFIAQLGKVRTSP